MIRCSNCSIDTVDLLQENKEIEGMFINWIPTTKEKKAKDLLIQTDWIKKSIEKKFPTVIFDGRESLLPEEVRYFQKFPFIHLCSSAIIRNFGEYLPYWVKIRNLDNLQLNEDERPIDLLYKGRLSDRIKSFERYYLWVKTYWPNLKVAYNCNDLIPEKEIEYEKAGLAKTNLSYDSAHYTIILGTDDDYTRGYLDPYYFIALKNNCIPILAEEHRFYKSLPFTSDWYKYNLNMYETIYLGELLDIHARIAEYHPEMTAENFQKSVYTMMKGK